MEQKIELVESFKGLTKSIVNFFENTLLKNSNISCSELSVMNALIDAENEDKKMNITELSHSLKITKSAISQLVTRLEKKGYIKRKINLFDKKVNYLIVTEEGKKECSSNQEILNKIAELVNLKMGNEDSVELSRLIEKLSGIIKELEGEEIC